MQAIHPDDPPPPSRLELPGAPPEQSPLEVLDAALRSPQPPSPERKLLAHDERATAPAGELPDLATRIEEAQRQARERRVQHGLTPDPDDGAYTLKRHRKHAVKRGKKHGQFLGTACDSWADKTRAP